MSRIDYSAVDAAILKRIRDGGTKYFEIHALDVLEAIATLPPEARDDEFRVTDRRLQALRRAGRIRYQARHWSLATPEA